MLSKEDLERLPPNLRLKYKTLLVEQERFASDNSLKQYFRSAWAVMEPNLKFIDGWHIGAICEHLEAVVNGEIDNLLINIPPRHIKSTIVSVAFPTWLWTKLPHVKFLYGSHSDSLAKRDSIKCRNIIQSAWYNELFRIKWKLAEDQNEKKHFKNTEGGFRRSTSVLASIIGEGGDINVLDDPHSPRSVRSNVKREDELRWIDEEFYSRINDPKNSKKICIMQRLDMRDASAHLLAQGNWEHLMLPARYEDARKCITSIGFEDKRKKEGEPLWPERFDDDGLTKYEKTIGSRAVPGQMQQRPSAQQGLIFKRKWFNQFYKELPANMDLIAMSIDLPFDEGGTRAVFAVWGKLGAQKYLIDVVKGEVGFNEQITMCRSTRAKHKMTNVLWVEKKANGAAMISTLMKEIPGIVPVEPKGSKVLRAEACAPQFEAGNVWLPDPEIAPWIGDWIEEHVSFPDGLYNDQVDTTSQALMKMSESVSYDWSPQSITGQSKFYGR